VLMLVAITYLVLTTKEMSYEIDGRNLVDERYLKPWPQEDAGPSCRE